MELDRSLTSLFRRLCKSLSGEEVELMDFLLRVNFPHRWPRPEQLNARTLLTKMMELEMWKVDRDDGECSLSFLIDLLDEIGRRDLASAVQDFGWLSHHSSLKYNIRCC